MSYAPSLTDLPPEILIQVTGIVCTSESTPRHVASLLSTCTLLRDIILCHLHTHLSFRTLDQLTAFHRCLQLSCVPKTLSLTFAGGAADYSLFPSFKRVVLHILEIMPKDSEVEDEGSGENREKKGVLGLQTLQLCLNSLSTDPNGVYLYEVLKLTNPEEFIWTGPDPEHHFSIAIVASSVFLIFEALAFWTQLRYLKLTNMAFPNGLLSGPHKMTPTMFALTLAGNGMHGDMRRHFLGYKPRRNIMLQSVYIGQTTFLDPELVAVLACESIFERLESVKIVDAYQGSIWGPRVRLDDVLKASDQLGKSEENKDGVGGKEWRRERIRAIVKCTAERERIIGGDRMDDESIARE